MTVTAVQKKISKIAYNDLREGTWFSRNGLLYVVTKDQKRTSFDTVIRQVIALSFDENGSRGFTEVQKDWYMRDVTVKLVWSENFRVQQPGLFENPDPDLDLLEDDEK